MSLAIGGEGGRVTSIAVETIRKANDAIKVEGKGIQKMLDGAAEVAKTAGNDSNRGHSVNTYA